MSIKLEDAIKSKDGRSSNNTDFYAESKLFDQSAINKLVMTKTSVEMTSFNMQPESESFFAAR